MISTNSNKYIQVQGGLTSPSGRRTKYHQAIKANITKKEEEEEEEKQTKPLTGASLTNNHVALFFTRRPQNIKHFDLYIERRALKIEQ